MDMVVAATDDEALNYHISDVCKSMKIPVNAVDMKDACSFIFPAMIKDKDMLVTVSTGGQSPAASAYIKKKIKSNIPDYYGDMIETIGQYRDMILTQVDNSRDRKEIFMELLEYGDAHNGDIPEELVYSLVNNKKRVD
jgi:siroheme synthase-like protein